MAQSKDKRIDQHIKDAPPFVKPIFSHLRKVVHAACPSVEETIKWDSPWYMYQGKVLCGTVYFKAHCVLIFNKWAVMAKKEGAETKLVLKGLRRIESVKDLPSSAKLKSLIKLAMKLNEPGADLGPKKERKVKPPVEAPKDLMLALRANPKAMKNYKAYTESNKRHYVEWINDAKTEDTREKRLEKTIDCLAAGKIKHWEK